jgi:hypothetical protein
MIEVAGENDFNWVINQAWVFAKNEAVFWQDESGKVFWTAVRPPRQPELPDTN